MWFQEAYAALTKNLCVALAVSTSNGGEWSSVTIFWKIKTIQCRTLTFDIITCCMTHLTLQYWQSLIICAASYRRERRERGTTFISSDDWFSCRWRGRMQVALHSHWFHIFIIFLVVLDALIVLFELLLDVGAFSG